MSWRGYNGEPVEFWYGLARAYYDQNQTLQGTAANLTSQYNTALANLQSQADNASAQAKGEFAAASYAKDQYNVKATMLENAITNLGLPPEKDSAPAKPDIKKPLFFIAIAAMGYFYWKGSFKL